jgi:aryl-alcohol dehydrogenase-like predicted oxidoreductase
MEERNLGTSGLRVSVAGLGCNNFGGRIGLEKSREVIHKALDLGFTLFDTADIYGGEPGASETVLGESLGERRGEIVLATKFGSPMDQEGRLKGASRRYIMSAVEESLKRLRTDWIDLYQLHFPDPLTPMEETLRALDDLVHQGKVRYIGSSNLPGWQVADAEWTARSLGLNGFISVQDEYSLLVRGVEKEVLPAARAYRLGVLPYFPLASGLLTGKYRRGEEPPEGTRFASTPSLAERYVNERNLVLVEKLETFARERGHSVLELAICWLLARPQVASVIAGATRPEQVEEHVRAAGWTLSSEDLEEIERLMEGTS